MSILCERIADQARQKEVQSFTVVLQGVLQRTWACGNHMMGEGRCEECAKKKTSLQKKLVCGASNDPLEQEADRIAEQVMAASARR